MPFLDPVFRVLLQVDCKQPQIHLLNPTLLRSRESARRGCLFSFKALKTLHRSESRHPVRCCFSFFLCSRLFFFFGFSPIKVLQRSEWPISSEKEKHFDHVIRWVIIRTSRFRQISNSQSEGGRIWDELEVWFRFSSG